jgi:chemotaxis response regulator CheB
MIVEPSPIVQEGLRKIIEATPEFSVEWTFYDTNRLKEHCLSHNPDIVIFNPSLIGMSAKNSIRHTFEIDDETPLDETAIKKQYEKLENMDAMTGTVAEESKPSPQPSQESTSQTEQKGVQRKLSFSLKRKKPTEGTT